MPNVIILNRASITSNCRPCVNDAFPPAGDKSAMALDAGMRRIISSIPSATLE